MKNKYKYLPLLILFFASTAFAINIKRFFQDIKLPSQQMVEKQTFTNPAAAGTADILSANTGPSSSAAATVTSFVAQPDVPRTIIITPGTSTGDVAECTITVSGTDILGATMSETFPFVADQSGARRGNKAFNTVTSVAWPANCEDAPFVATWSIGYDESLGVKRCMSNKGDVVHSLLNGDKEGTAPTVLVDDDEVEKNVADFNGTMNGSNDFVLYFFQNYQCSP